LNNFKTTRPKKGRGSEKKSLSEVGKQRRVVPINGGLANRKERKKAQEYLARNHMKMKTPGRRVRETKTLEGRIASREVLPDLGNAMNREAWVGTGLLTCGVRIPNPQKMARAERRMICLGRGRLKQGWKEKGSATGLSNEPTRGHPKVNHSQQRHRSCIL